MSKKMSRREFLKFLAASAGGVVLVSCGPAPTPQSVEVEVTRVVAGTPVVEKVVVTATPEATMAPAAVADVLGTSPAGRP